MTSTAHSTSSLPQQQPYSDQSIPVGAPPPYTAVDPTPEETTIGTSDDIDPELAGNQAGSAVDSETQSSPAMPATQSNLHQRYLFNIFSFEEAVVFAIYPITVCLGSLVSVISQPDTYFSSKRNFFNVIFVKNGWFWTTIVFLIHCVRLRISRPQGLLMRYAITTLWWYLFTQWFFGAPLMDRIFLGTGGTCQVGDRPSHSGWTSVGCRHAAGEWTGGHDISGHSFLLTHASLFLWYEILPVLTERGPLARQINTKV